MYTSGVYKPKSAPYAKPPDIFDQLYENKPKTKFYKVSDSVPSEQRIIEENCTFQPVINESCPFISERTLRNFAHRQRQRRPPPPPTTTRTPSRSPLKRNARDARISGNIAEEPLSGIYTKQGGFKRGPPTRPDMPIYYFDPIAPPSFESGKYHTGDKSASTEPFSTEVYEDVVVTDDEEEGKDSLPAPPLPDWAFTPGGPPTAAAAAAKKGIVIPIKKGPKKDEAPAPTGWQAVLAEMTRKKEQIMNKGNLKKPEPIVEKAPSGPMKKKGKKKKGSKDFKDVMDELNYKLAKLRGEVDEGDDTESEEDVEVQPKTGKKVVSNTDPNTPANTPVPDTTGSSPVPMEPVSTPKAGKKGGVGLTADGEADGDSPAVAPTRKLPSKESMMNLLSKVTKPSGAASTESTEGKSEASVGKAKPAAPNLAAMFAKRAGAEDPSGAAAKPSAGSDHALKPAVPKPDSVPAPPPVPVTWPPAAHTAVEPEGEQKPTSNNNNKKKKTVRKLVTKTDNAQGGKTTVTEEMSDLPEGYYMSAPVIGMVRPRHILAGGATSTELVNSLKLAFSQAAEAAEALAMGLSPEPQTPHVQYDLSAMLTSPHLSHSHYGTDEYKSDYNYESGDEVRAREWNELSPHQHIKERLAVSDLPLPPDFHTAVQRMQQCNKKREEKLQRERDLELRSFLYYEKSDKTTDPPGTPGSGKKLEVTVPVEFVSHVDNHLEKKQYSHRKSATATSAASRASRDGDEDLPLNERISSAYKVPSTVYQRASTTDLVTTYWLNNLRPSVNTPAGNSSPAGSKPVSRNASHTHLAATHPHSSPSLAPPAYRTKTPQKTTANITAFGGTGSRAPVTPNHALAQSFISPIGMGSMDTSSDLSSLDEQRMTPGAKYFLNFRPQTQPKAPKLRSDELISRRQSARKDREERERQQQREEEEAARQRKLAMKARAMQAAQEAGAYKASTRYHQHQKIFQKYSQHPDVGHNIERSAKVAYAQYTTSHHLQPTQGDQLYAASAQAQAQRRAAAAANKQHQLELSQIHDLQLEYQEYEDSQNRVEFSPNRRNILHY